jgi:predicted nucleic acid-binding protein
VIVVDASVLANAVGDDGGDGERARQELRSAGDVAAPDLVDVETTAVLRKRWQAKTITTLRFAEAIDDLEDLTIDRYPPLRFMRRAYELRDNLTAYAAAYVALAETLGCELLTADQRLSKAPGPRCPVRLLR